MILPTYITEKQKQEIAKLIKNCEPKYVPLLKKMILVAAYGTMIEGKISFTDLLQSIKNQIKFGYGYLDNFWSFKEKAKTDDKKFFGIPYKIIYNEPMQIVEKEIIKLMYGKIPENIGSTHLIEVRDHIKEIYQVCFKKMFNNI